MELFTSGYYEHKVNKNQMGKLIEEEKINEMSLSIKIPPLNCRLCEIGRMPQGCAAAHCWGQGVGIGE